MQHIYTFFACICYRLAFFITTKGFLNPAIIASEDIMYTCEFCVNEKKTKIYVGIYKLCWLTIAWKILLNIFWAKKYIARSRFLFYGEH